MDVGQLAHRLERQLHEIPSASSLLLGHEPLRANASGYDRDRHVGVITELVREGEQEVR